MQVTDLPRDPYNALNGIRSKLVQTANSCRHSQSKRVLFRETLVSLLEFIDGLDTQPAPTKKAAPETKRRATAKVDVDAI